MDKQYQEFHTVCLVLQLRLGIRFGQLFFESEPVRRQRKEYTSNLSVILDQKKKELFDIERASQKDHTEKYRDFLPRGAVRHLDNRAANLPRARKKANTK